MESLRCEQTKFQQRQQEALTQVASAWSPVRNSGATRRQRAEECHLSSQIHQMHTGRTAGKEVGQSHRTVRRLQDESRRKAVANKSVPEAGTHILTYASHDHDDDEEDGEGIRSGRLGDPCFHYTVLDQAWRASNASSKLKMCDRQVNWKGKIFCLLEFLLFCNYHVITPTYTQPGH